MRLNQMGNIARIQTVGQITWLTIVEAGTGTKNIEPNYLDFKVFGEVAKNLIRYQKVGNEILVEFRMQGQHQDKDGKWHAASNNAISIQYIRESNKNRSERLGSNQNTAPESEVSPYDDDMAM